MTLDKVKEMCKQQITAAESHTEDDSSELLYGDQSDYKRGGVDALRGVLQLLEQVDA